ncbi:uncharacterized protein BYT42DRAFT_284167 [Radiomyces spectabilis]|uniref:uncharacterized protein n=1 Tax=Radiomyces spectabilis TaxID=64574 RepID=UPI00221E7D23|nr:uncharacterized protein BYT42DRAFT_284167 [Radiomyces spectabilis]KAI8385041.1 hypothetical protein BYT42DRAFT_284167 [Radiomyces spectabilis]
MVLEGVDAVARWQAILGPADPAEATEEHPTSIRALYGVDSMHNACHGTTSEEELEHEFSWLQSVVIDDLTFLSDTVRQNYTKKSVKKQAIPTPTSNSRLPTVRNQKKSPIGAVKPAADKPSAVPRLGPKPATQSARTATTRKPSPTTAVRKSASQNTPSAVPSKLPSTGQTTRRPNQDERRKQVDARKKTHLPGNTSGNRDHAASTRIATRNEAAAGGRRGSMTSTKLSTTGGISKNTPPISVLTGRTRKYSRSVPKKEAPEKATQAAATPKPADTVAEPQTELGNSEPVAVLSDDVTEEDGRAKLNEEEKHQNPTLQEISDGENSANDRKTERIKEDDAYHSNDEGFIEAANMPMNQVDLQPMITESATSIISQSDRDSKVESESEHDAEVAATTSMRMTTPLPSRPSLTDRRTSSSSRASFSPRSMTSLPRPETPEVDQLRQRFEVLAMPAPVIEKRPSVISPEIALRIKDMKPKDPAGARVKSMVEFFMDENLHKWEF